MAEKREDILIAKKKRERERRWNVTNGNVFGWAKS